MTAAFFLMTDGGIRKSGLGDAPPVVVKTIPAS
jgi:hypothetical protein